MTTRSEASDYETGRTVGLPEVLQFLRRGALVALLLAAVFGALEYWHLSRATPQYRASVALLASSPGGGYGNLGLVTPPPVDPSVYKTALLDGPVAADALKGLLGQAPTAGHLRAFVRSITVGVQKQTMSSIIAISVDDPDPKFAVQEANALADSLMAWDRARAREAVAGTIQSLQQTIQDLDNEIRGVGGTAPNAATVKALTALRDQRASELAAARATSQSSVAIGLLEPLSSAAPPAAPVGPKAAFKTLAAALFGLILAYGWFLVRWFLDPRVRDRDELASLTGLPILAEFAVRTRGSGRTTTEAANFLRSNVVQLARSESPVAIAITSPHAPREKAGVAVNLAASLARVGHRTLLVDADLRQPSRAYGLDISDVDSTPLEVHLENPSRSYAPVTVQVGAGRAFDFVPSFTAASYPVELLDRGFAELLRAWRERYDYILVDCPPALPFADTLTVTRLCTGSVLCASPAVTHRRDLEESLERLRQIDARILGVVLTDARGARRLRQRQRLEGFDMAAHEAVDPYSTLGRGSGMTNVTVKRR